MTTDLEDQLTAGMHQHVRDLTLTGDVLGRARRRYRRRSAVVRLGYGLGVIGVAGALAVGVTVASGGTDPGGAPPVAGDRPGAKAQPPALRLANAAAATNDTSYRITVSQGGSATRDGAPFGSSPMAVTWEGAFDPRTDTGYARSAFEWGVRTELVINGTRYVGTEPRADGAKPPGEHEAYSRYGQYPGTYDRLSLDDANSVLGTSSPSPTSLLETLRKVDAGVTEKPDGTLHFEYALANNDGKSFLRGDVTIDAGRITKIAITGTWESTVKRHLDQGEFSTTIEFADFGLPVTVERPADVVPVR
jgi:hypothetical protein